MKSYSSREVIEMIKANGWYLVRIRGSHHYFKHPLYIDSACVPHPKSSIPISTLKSISKQTHVEFP